MTCIFTQGKLKSSFDYKCKQGNRGDMRKIPVTWQFFEARGRHEVFLDLVIGIMYAKFQVCIIFRLARRRDTNK